MSDNLKTLPPFITRVSGWKSAAALLADWSWILGAAALAELSPWLLPLALLVIATRQHALFLLMHEGSHFLLFQGRRWNDRLCNLMAAWPVGISTEAYRERHWRHHLHLNTAGDPDWARKQGDLDWVFPSHPLRFWKGLVPYLFGKGLMEMGYAFYFLGPLGRSGPAPWLYYGAFSALVSWLGAWKLVGLYWLLPYFTLLPLLHRFRYSTEHFALPGTHAFSSTRNVLCGPLEAFLFAPHSGSLHLVHHTFPSVPWHRLSQARILLLGNGDYARLARENTSYFLPWGNSVYRDLTGDGQIKTKEDKVKTSIRQFRDRCFERVMKTILERNWEDPSFYGNFLAQTHYHICHSTRLLAAAAARFGTDRDDLHLRCIRHAAEERSHEKLSVSDLRELGLELHSFPEQPATKALYQATYFLIEHTSPVAIFGYAYFLETVGVAGSRLEERLAAAHGKRAVKHIALHAHEDPSHLEEYEAMLESFSGEDRQVLLEAIETTAAHYERMVMETAQAVSDSNEAKAA